jgi:hypothetical protein
VDHLYFLDSTFARFWFFRDDLLPHALSVLTGVKGARVLTAELLLEHGAAGLGRPFADLALWALPGGVFLPNFYQEQKRVKGMHGYPREEPANWTAFAAWGPGISSIGWTERPAALRNVFATLVAMLAMPETSVPAEVRPLFTVRPHA